MIFLYRFRNRHLGHSDVPSVCSSDLVNREMDCGDQSARDTTPLNLRRASPSLKPQSDSPDSRKRNQLDEATDESDDCQQQRSGRRESVKKNPSYTEVARHPLKRRRIEFLKQMKDSSHVEPLKASPSDSSLSLSWTAGPNKDNVRSSTEGSDAPDGQFQATRFYLGTDKLEANPPSGRHSEKNIEPRMILEQCEIDKDEKNVSKNCILDYITRCNFSRKTPKPSQQHCWEYGDFKTLATQSTKPAAAADSDSSNENTHGPKMSALDFLLSKFLMEKDDDQITPRNDHAREILNGEKKGTLNLFDVMELQVELGLA